MHANLNYYYNKWNKKVYIRVNENIQELIAMLKYFWLLIMIFELIYTIIIVYRLLSLS